MAHRLETLNATAVALITAWNTKDLEAMLALYTDDCLLEDIGFAQPVQGPEGARRVYLYTQAGFGGLHFTLHRTVEQDDTVVFEWSAQGQQIRRVMGIPATHRMLTISGVTWLHLRAGRIAYSKRVWDMAGLLRQMGLLPDLPTV
jgi:steroid delta-isomerase-like uncharacterized protein